MHDVASTGAAGHDVDSGVRVLDLVAALTVEAKAAKFAGWWGYTLHVNLPEGWPWSGALARRRAVFVCKDSLDYFFRDVYIFTVHSGNIFSDGY